MYIVCALIKLSPKLIVKKISRSNLEIFKTAVGKLELNSSLETDKFSSYCMLLNTNTILSVGVKGMVIL